MVVLRQLAQNSHITTTSIVALKKKREKKSITPIDYPFTLARLTTVLHPDKVKVGHVVYKGDPINFLTGKNW